MRGLFFTAAIRLQSASPLYNCARVLPWMVSALMPMSCNLSATSSIFLLLSSQPNLVFTVTGRLVERTTASVRRTIRSTSLRTAAPAPLQTTFFTGQPKLMSTRSGCTGIHNLLRSWPLPLHHHRRSGYRKVFLNSEKSSFCLLLMASRINPSLEMNSLYMRSAPFCLQT